MAQGELTEEELRRRFDLSRESLKNRILQNWQGYIFVVPLVILFLILFYYPMIKGVYMTFTNSRVGATAKFIGIDNYIWMITNDLFVFSLGWSLVFTLSVTFLQLSTGLVIALFLNELRSGRREWIAAIVMAPFFSAPLAGGVIWEWFLDPTAGFVPRILGIFISNVPALLTEGFWPHVSLIIAQTWHDYAYASIIYLAALTSIPKEQYEAAAIAGAGRIQRFREITVPHLLTPTIIILALRTTYNLAEFAQPFQLTGGGPGTRTMLLSILTYQVAFRSNFLGRAYTIGLVMVLIAAITAAVYISTFQQEEELVL